MASIIRDVYTYTTGRVAVAAGVSVTTNIAIQADADFEIHKLTMFADIAGAAQTDSTRVLPNASILIRDTGSGRQLMNVAVALASLFGTGEEPFIMTVPKIIKARSNLEVTITSFEAANTNNISVNFIGAKIFTLG